MGLAYGIGYPVGMFKHYRHRIPRVRVHLYGFGAHWGGRAVTKVVQDDLLPRIELPQDVKSLRVFITASWLCLDPSGYVQLREHRGYGFRAVMHVRIPAGPMLWFWLLFGMTRMRRFLAHELAHVVASREVGQDMAAEEVHGVLWRRAFAAIMGSKIPLDPGTPYDAWEARLG